MFKEMLEQVKQLSPEDRLRLMRFILDTLLPKPGGTTPPQFLHHGEFHGPGMSTEADFGLTEETPAEQPVHGA